MLIQNNSAFDISRLCRQKGLSEFPKGLEKAPASSKKITTGYICGHVNAVFYDSPETTENCQNEYKLEHKLEHNPSIEKSKIDGMTYLTAPLSATSSIELDSIKIK